MDNDEIIKRMQADAKGITYRRPMRIEASSFVMPVALIGGIAWICLADSGRIAVNEDGMITNKVDVWRECVQGRRFWQNQLNQIDQELRDLNAAPAQTFDPVVATQDWNAVMEKVYQEYPEVRPTPTQRRIEQLREQADALEFAEAERILAQMKERRLTELHRIRPRVVAKLQGGGR